MYIDVVPNRNSRPAILLRQSRREGKKTIKTTLANMTDWPKGLVDAIRLAVRGETMVPKDAVFAIEESVPHGHVQAVLGTIKNLGVHNLIASKPCRERDLAAAMIAERIIYPCSKLAAARHWHDTTLARELGVEDADEDDLYAAMDWVLKRQQRIENKLAKIQAEGARRTKKPLEAGAIGIKCGKALKQYKMAKHFSLEIKDGFLKWGRKGKSIERETELDGIYVIRTSEPRQRFSAEDTVRTYKSLSLVEQAFRCLKGVDLLVRPIRHRTVDHVRAHVFLCMLAYYVEWHMRKALAPILFQDEELDQARQTRDPVAKAEPSASVKKKKATRMTSDGWPVQSFQTLLDKLATRCRNRCRVGNEKAHALVFELTEPTPLQAHIFELLGVKS